MPTPGWIAHTAPLLSVSVPLLNGIPAEPEAEALDDDDEALDADEEDDDELLVEEIVDEPAIVGAED
jgi:hypothetical protein